MRAKLPNDILSPIIGAAALGCEVVAAGAGAVVSDPLDPELDDEPTSADSVSSGWKDAATALPLTQEPPGAGAEPDTKLTAAHCSLC